MRTRTHTRRKTWSETMTQTMTIKRSKGRVHKKKPEKVWSFAKPGGAGLGG